MTGDAHDTLDGALLARYFAGHPTAADEARVGEWLAHDTARLAELGALREVWQRARRSPEPRPSAPAWDQLASRIATYEEGRRDRPGPRARRAPASRWRTQWPVASAVVASIAIIAVVWRTAATLSHDDTPTASDREFTVPRGARTALTLRDGTRVILAPATHLRVPADFARARREVQVDGEAIFTVVHDATRPFMVRVANAVVTDVGTVFDVRAYPSDAAVRVAVAEGAVCVRTRQGRPTPEEPCSAAARAGDVATAATDGITIRHNADITSLIAWTQGHLVFTDTPLATAARELDRAFDLDITIADSALAAQPITGTFEDSAPPDAVLDAVTRVVGAQYERTNRRVTIHGRAAGAYRPMRGPVLPPVRTAQADAPGRS